MNDVPTFTPLSTAVPDYVRQGERLLWRGRPTLAVLVRQTFGLVVAFFFFSVFALGAASEAGARFVYLVPLVVAVAVLFFVLNMMRLRRTQYVVTDHGVYTRTGIIGQTVMQTTFDKITDISLKQDVLGRILGYASLNVNTAGSNTAPVQMEGLRDALSIKQLIEVTRERFLGGGRGREPEPPRRLPRFIPERDLVGLVCPETKKPFRRPKTELGTLVPCPHCGAKHRAEVKKPGRPRAA